MSLRAVRPAPTIVAALVLAMALAGCMTADSTPPVTPSAGPAGPFGLALVVDGLADPVDVAAPDGRGGDLLVVEQGGRILRLPGGSPPAVPFLDIGDRVLSGGERGLLGLALHPGYAANGRFFVDYTDLEGNTVVAEYRRSGDGTGDHASERVLLGVPQPAANHNGGAIRFGLDGLLYVALGDGGGGNSGNGRRRDTLLGKILRLDVDSPSPSGAGYVVPPDNPFGGTAAARPEIWATGLRNPWRFSVDPATGDLWIGDVGASSREEVDHAPAGHGGLDFGWDAMEGTLCHLTAPCDTTGLTPPVAEYAHDSGCVVSGGVVYRGRALPALAGRYLFADYCSGVISTLDAGAVSAGSQAPGVLLETGRAIVSFGIDAAGEVLVVDHAGAVLRLVLVP